MTKSFHFTWPPVFSQNLRHRVLFILDMRKLTVSERESGLTKATQSVKSSAWLPTQDTVNLELLEPVCSDQSALCRVANPPALCCIICPGSHPAPGSENSPRRGITEKKYNLNDKGYSDLIGILVPLRRLGEENWENSHQECQADPWYLQKALGNMPHLPIFLFHCLAFVLWEKNIFKYYLVKFYSYRCNFLFSITFIFKTRSWS